MKKTLKRTVRLGISVVILAMLVAFATKVNWHDTWRAITNASP